MLRNSFRARLILGAAIWISVGMLVSGLLLSQLLRELVTRQVDHDLSDHAEELRTVALVDSEARLSVQHQLSDPRFLRVGSGMYWQIERQNGEVVRSPSLADDQLPLDSITQASPRIVVITTPRGTLRLNQLVVQGSQLEEPLHLGIGVALRLIDEEVAHLNRVLAFSMAIVALGLTGAAVIQVAFGLRPLTRIRRELLAVRTGESDRLPDDLPEEVAPLVNDLNAMIAANNDMVRRARTQAGSLAHALKTPLAILMDEARQLETADHSEAASTIKQQCQQMQRQIDYQMARARAAGRGTAGAVTAIGPAIHTVLSALTRLHHDRGVTLDYTGPQDLVVACDPQDFSEIIGNLADNAAKWARSRVLISANRNHEAVFIKVEDDGPGIPAQSWETVFGIGEKLDQKMPGSGLGLAITRELLTLYGGQIWLDRSPLGGTLASLQLPMPKLEDTYSSYLNPGRSDQVVKVRAG